MNELKETTTTTTTTITNIIRRNRTPALQRSLCFVIQSLQNVQVVIELKNDYEVRGIVQQCDEKMNVLLSQVIMTTIQRKEEMYDEMLVKGRSIRYVHFPPFINIHAQVAQYRKKMESNRRKNMPNKIVDKKSLSVNSLQKRKIEEIVLDNTNYEDEESEGEDDYDALDAIGDEQES